MNRARKATFFFFFRDGDTISSLFHIRGFVERSLLVREREEAEERTRRKMKLPLLVFAASCQSTGHGQIDACHPSFQIPIFGNTKTGP